MTRKFEVGAEKVDTIGIEAGSMTVSLEEEGFVTIKMPLERNPRPSHQGHHDMVATTHGNVTTRLLVDGKTVTVNVNLFTMKPEV